MDIKEAYKAVYNHLMTIPIINGMYDQKHGSLTFMSGVETVMEFIALQADMIDDFDKRFVENLDTDIGLD